MLGTPPFPASLKKPPFRYGMRMGNDGALLGLPMMAWEIGRAPKGEMSSVAVAKISSFITYPIFTGLITAALVLIPGVNVGTAAFLATWLAMSPSGALEDGINRSVSMLTHASSRARHLEFGAGYQDTQTAQRARMRAVQDMNAALLPSRRMLGQEALLLHR